MKRPAAIPVLVAVTLVIGASLAPRFAPAASRRTPSPSRAATATPGGGGGEPGAAIRAGGLAPHAKSIARRHRHAAALAAGGPRALSARWPAFPDRVQRDLDGTLQGARQLR